MSDTLLNRQYPSLHPCLRVGAHGSQDSWWSKGADQPRNSEQCNDNRSDKKHTRIHARVYGRRNEKPHASTLETMINPLDEKDPRRLIGSHASSVQTFGINW